MIKATIDNIAVTGDGVQFIVLLKTETTIEEIVPIAIGPLEAMSIVNAKQGTYHERPMSHDLMMSMLELVNTTINRVEITDLKDSTFYAQLILDSRGIELDIDARPSDAIALALRSKAPIFIAETVVAQAGINNLDDDDSMPISKKESFEA